MLPILVFGVWRVRLANDVGRRLAAIRAAGLPANCDELNFYYRAVPDAENAALVVTQAFALMASYPDARSDAVYKFVFPSPSKRLTPEQRSLLAGHVESNRLAIQTAMQVVARPKSRYPIDLSPGFAALLPHLSKVKNLAQTISFQGALAAEDNRPKEAIQCIGAILQLSRTLEGEPLLISQLIRYRMDGMTKVTLERCLNAGQLSGENLTFLDQSLHGWEGTNRLFLAMIGERAVCMPLFQMNFAQFYRFAQFQDVDIRDTHQPPGSIPLTILMRGSGFFQRDLQFYLTIMETNISLSKLTPPANLAITNVWREAVEEAVNRKFVMSAILLPALDKAYFKDAESTALIRLSRVALVIEKFRLLEHRLPATLDELGNLGSSEGRIDPFDGQPLRYKQLEKGYVVYSVGPDGQDNGGRERPPDAKSTDKTPYDITFTVER